MPLTALALENASEDCEVLEQILNSTSLTTETRLSGTVDTIRGALTRFGYSAPVVFANGISVTIPTQTVDYLGTIYAPLPSALPFTTTGTFNSAQWYVVQFEKPFVYDHRNYASGINIPTHANFIYVCGYSVLGDGGEGVYKRVGSAPAHPGKFQSLDGAWWELAEYEPNPFMFGGKANGVYDDKTACSDAVAFASSVQAVTGGVVQVNLLGRTWKTIAGPIVMTGYPNVELTNGTIDFSTVAVHSNAYINVYAGVVGEGTLSSNIVTLTETNKVGSMECLVNTTGLAAGDLVLVGQDPKFTTLNGSHNSSVTTLTVVSTTGFPASGFVLVDSEIIAYTAVASGTALTVRATNGRGRIGTSAASHSSGARVVLLNHGMAAFSRSTPVVAVEANYVQATRTLGSAQAVLMRYSFDRAFSPTFGAWIKRVTPLSRPRLSNMTFIGSNSQGRGGGQEVGYYFRYADDVHIDNVKLKNCSDSHGMLDTCFNFNVLDNQIVGKADSSVYDGHYGISVLNGCHWGTIRGTNARNAYKTLTLWASGISSSQAWYGFPRHIKIQGGEMLNSGTPWDGAHELYEAHCWVEHVRFENITGIDAAGGISFEGGKDIAVVGAGFHRWSRSGITMDGAYAMKGLYIDDVQIGERTLLASGTLLNGAINNSVTTLVFDFGDWFTDLLTDGTDALVLIDSEQIKLGTQTTAGTFTGCTRGMNGTTAASHADNTRVFPAGHAYATPFDLVLNPMQMYLDHPDKFATFITGSLTNSDTTVAVSKLEAFDAATATNPGYAEIESDTSGGESEIIAYTGKSASSGAGNLTGVVRGLFGPNAIAHSANQLIQQFTFALEDVQIKQLKCKGDHLRSLITATGYIPSRNCAIIEPQLAYTGGERHNTYSYYFEPHGWEHRHPSFAGLPYGINMQGNENRVYAPTGKLGIADATGGGLVSLSGDRNQVDNPYGDGYYLVARTEAAADKSIIHGTRGRRIAAGTNGVSDSGSNSSVTDGAVVA